jgi:hypothetical protein
MRGLDPIGHIAIDSRHALFATRDWGNERPSAAVLASSATLMR